MTTNYTDYNIQVANLTLRIEQVEKAMILARTEGKDVSVWKTTLKELTEELNYLMQLVYEDMLKKVKGSPD